MKSCGHVALFALANFVQLTCGLWLGGTSVQQYFSVRGPLEHVNISTFIFHCDGLSATHTLLSPNLVS